MENTAFDPEKFLDDLIREMHLQNSKPEKLEALRQAMYAQMNEVILNAVSLHLEPAVIDYVADEFRGETDSSAIFVELVANSPASQVAIYEALEEFRQQTLDAYKTLVKIT